MNNIRNIAIIAHVDHGKTTLVDMLLRESNTNLGKQAATTCIMDSNDLERERGITIFSKNAAVQWHGVKINIIDTPGHADFGGEVERVLKMADGVLLLVDAKEGPMPQTKFVLKKALAMGHKAIVVINKIDKKDARPDWVLDKTFDLFCELGATDEQTDFPVIYASAILGKTGETADLAAMTDATPLFEKILEYIPAPSGDAAKPFQMLTVAINYDNYKGKIAIGRVYDGHVSAGDTITHINREGVAKKVRVSALMNFEGLLRKEVESIEAGDIAAIAGISDVNIGDTLADKENPTALPPIDIEKPTVKMIFSVNDSPFGGNEGKYSTSRNLRERLYRELDSDVALNVTDGVSADQFIVSGRGELHLSILIEKMRREGYELQASRPEVILQKDANGKNAEPFEDVWIEVPEKYSGTVIEKMGRRKGELRDMKTEIGTAYFHFHIPTRGLIGFRNEFLTDTRGTGILNSLFAGYEPYAEGITATPHGSLIAYEDGESNTYGLVIAEGRGTLFIGPNVQVYRGMIVGQNAKAEDLDVNVCKTKRLSNMRSKGDGTADALSPPRVLTLEEAIEYIGDDELVEVTPKSIRLRKRELDALKRKRDKVEVRQKG